MSVFTFEKDQPLTKAGLRFVHVVQKAELGFQPAMSCSSFPTVGSSIPVWRVDESE